MSETARKRTIASAREIETWEGIANRIGKSINTARRYAARDVDPLPVRIFGGKAYAAPDKLDEWKKRNSDAPKPPKTDID